MLIGGSDIIYPRKLSREMLNFSLRIVRAFWPDAWVWVDSDDTNYAKMMLTDAIANLVGTPVELLIYADETVWTSWDAEGATAANGDQLLHVLLGESSTTFVVHHEPNALTKQMAACIIQALDVNFPRS